MQREHEWEGKWQDGKDQEWETSLAGCLFCSQRLKRQLEKLNTHSPNHTILIVFALAGDCCAELQFVDPEDGISEWTYRFRCRLFLKERKMYGSTV